MTTTACAFIEASGWGRKLDQRDLDKVCASVRDLSFEPGECLVRSGDAAEYWVGVVEGVAVQQVTNEEGKAAMLTAGCAGTWFGEGTLMKQERWRYDAIARGHTKAVLVPYSTFKWLCDTSLSFNQFIARLLNQRLAHFMGLLANERLTNAEQRMARMLASLFDPELYPERPALLRIKQSDLALLSGMSRQRANAALQRLGNEGLIEATRSGVKVLDVLALRGYQSGVPSA